MLRGPGGRKHSPPGSKVRTPRPSKWTQPAIRTVAEISIRRMTSSDPFWQIDPRDSDGATVAWPANNWYGAGSRYEHEPPSGLACERVLRPRPRYECRRDE